MKKNVVAVLISAFFIFTFVSAAECQLNVEIINQDPYPAIPGEYVKIVFQISGVENPSCEGARAQLIPEYPFSLDVPNTIKVMQENTHTTGYNSYWNIPYKIRVDKDAIEGENKIKLEYWPGKIDYAKIVEEFEIEIEESRADFEIYIKDYSYQTKEVTFEILNIEKTDVEALTLEIPKQEKINVKGTNRVIAGDLDSNEYTTADFEADLTDGEIKVNIIYTDSIGVRRTIEKTVNFDSDYFIGRGGEKGGTSIAYYLVVIVIIILTVWLILNKKKKKKERLARRRGMAKF